MTEITHAYWIAGEDAPERMIGGCCPIANMASYAVVDDLALPKCVVETERTHPDGDVVTTYISPPIFGGRYAYRMRMTLTPRDRAEIPGHNLGQLLRQISAEYIESPHKGTRRTNWWWAHRDSYWRHCDPTTSLRKRWTRDFLDIMTRNHPERDAILAEWDSQVAAHKSYVQRRNGPRNEARRRYGPKTRGSIVVSRRPILFESSSIRQVFVLQPFGKNDRLGPHKPSGLRFRVPTTDMQILCPEWFDDAGISGPVGYAAYLGSQHRALEKTSSRHEMIRVKGSHADLLADWKTRSDAALAEIEAGLAKATVIDNTLRGWRCTLMATQGALLDFCGTLSKDLAVLIPDEEWTAAQELRLQIDPLLRRLQLLENAHEVVARHGL